MLIRTHKAWERRPRPATSSPFATTTTSRSWRRSTALPCRPSRATARPAVGAPAASRGPLALGRPAGVDARDRAGRDHQHHGAPCRPGRSSTDRLVVGAPGAEEVFVLQGQSLGRVGELTEASAGLPPQAGDLFGATL